MTCSVREMAKVIARAKDRLDSAENEFRLGANRYAEREVYRGFRILKRVEPCLVESSERTAKHFHDVHRGLIRLFFRLP